MGIVIEGLPTATDDFEDGESGFLEATSGGDDESHGMSHEGDESHGVL